MLTNISKEHIAYIFRVEVKANQESKMKQAASKSLQGFVHFSTLKM
jgi:hypothetical protein